MKNRWQAKVASGAKLQRRSVRWFEHGPSGWAGADPLAWVNVADSLKLALLSICHRATGVVQLKVAYRGITLNRSQTVPSSSGSVGIITIIWVTSRLKIFVIAIGIHFIPEQAENRSSKK